MDRWRCPGRARCWALRERARVRLLTGSHGWSCSPRILRVTFRPGTLSPGFLDNVPRTGCTGRTLWETPPAGYRREMILRDPRSGPASRRTALPDGTRESLVAEG
jgi:hypothetical protein